MEQQLVLHEGLRTRAYRDTEGNWTIGIGYNLTGRGYQFIETVLGRKVRPIDGVTDEKVTITADEARRVLRADIDWFEKMVPVHFPFYLKLDEVRQRVVLDMAFNMGFAALGFKKLRAAVEARDWSRGVREMWSSKWARQVGDGPGGKQDRCDRLANMLLTGCDYVS